MPWRDAGTFGPGFQFAVEGYTPADGEENPHARMRIVAPGFFSVLGEDERASLLAILRKLYRHHVADASA